MTWVFRLNNELQICKLLNITMALNLFYIFAVRLVNATVTFVSTKAESDHSEIYTCENLLVKWKNHGFFFFTLSDYYFDTSNRIFYSFWDIFFFHAVHTRIYTNWSVYTTQFILHYNINIIYIYVYTISQTYTIHVVLGEKL